MSAPAGYEAIKEMARHRRVNITDLLVMARQNDPFFAGSPAQLRDAEWFATWWNELGYQGRSGVHLRAVHYRLVSQDTPPAMPNGLPYTNTLECWGYLNQASRMARHLKLVDVEAFEDHRNPDPVIYAADPEEFEPTLEMDDWPEWQLPEIAVDLDGFKLPLPEFYATGYRYSPACQPYHRELWIEKSTMNEVLRPVCQRYHTNLVSSIGFQSIPSTIALLRRAEAYGKPARVFYISDFDPAGSFMPDAVARQIEYWRLRLGIDIEVKLEPIALTREQVIRYRLPSIPIKESDRRAAGFEARYGMLATELDALEALRPGALARLVSAAITPYYDRNLHDAWDEASVEADAVADSATKWVADGETLTEWQAIQTGVRDILKQYSERVASLNDELQQELEPYCTRMEAVRHAVQAGVDVVDDVFQLPEAPEHGLEEPDEDDWLFDSSRGYMEQLAHYKARRNGGQEEPGRAA